MQIRSGAYRVPSESRSIPAERDAGRNRAILSIRDSLARARANKIFTPRLLLRSSSSYRERCIPIGYLLSRIQCRYRLRDSFATVSHRRLRPHNCTWPRLQGTRPLHESTSLSSAFLSLLLFLRKII